MKKIKNQIESFKRLEGLIIEEIDNQKEKVSEVSLVKNIKADTLWMLFFDDKAICNLMISKECYNSLKERYLASKFAYLGNECFKIKVYTEIEK